MSILGNFIPTKAPKNAKLMAGILLGLVLGTAEAGVSPSPQWRKLRCQLSLSQGQARKWNQARAELHRLMHSDEFLSPWRKAVIPSLENYFDHLGLKFKRIILGPTPLHIMDLSAGETVAAQELSGRRLVQSIDPITRERLLIRNQRTFGHRVSAVSMRTELPPANSAHFQHNSFRRFEDISDSESINRFGWVDVFVDWWGILGQTDRLEEALKKIVRMSHQGTHLFIKSEGPENTLRSTKIRLANGRELDLIDWLKQIPGISVTDVDSKPTGKSLHIQFMVAPAQIRIPFLILQEVQMGDGLLPHRVFMEIGAGF